MARVTRSLGALLLALLLFFAQAQPGPPSSRGGPRAGSGPPARDAVFAPGAALEAGQALLASLRPVAVFEHVHGRRDEKREVRVLLGGEGAVYGRFNLDPSTLEPVPIGLEGVTSPLPMGADPEVFYRAAEEIALELSLSAVVVPERAGYKLLLVYAGRIVGELKLNPDTSARTDRRWLDELERSSWRFPG